MFSYFLRLDGKTQIANRVCFRVTGINTKIISVQIRSVHKSQPCQPEQILVFQTKPSVKTDFSIMSDPIPPSILIYFSFKNTYCILRAFTTYCANTKLKWLICKRKPVVQKSYLNVFKYCLFLGFIAIILLQLKLISVTVNA